MRKVNVVMGILAMGLAILSSATGAVALDNPVPLVNQRLRPDAVAPGGVSFTLTVNGTGFVSGSMVNWNGTPRVTTFVNDSRLTAQITAADIAVAGTSSVTVVNPAPGGGTSNVAFFSVTSSITTLGFQLASSPKTGSEPTGLAIHDFNGDGILDIAIANFGDSTVTILLGDATGHFTLASTLTVGSNPECIAVGDFNGDGKPDLAVTNLYSNSVSILLGDGTGHFTLASSVAVGTKPEAIVAADFNGDGNLDLAVANSIGDTLDILLGDGTGHFTLTTSLATEDRPDALAVGDFNGDGDLDLVVGNYYGTDVTVLLGDGTGHFNPGPSLGGYDFVLSIAVGDFNGDGNLDLALAESAECEILLGDGAGHFTLASSFVPSGASVATGDFNGDGILDLALTETNAVAVRVGDGTGHFTLASTPTAGPDPEGVALGDFNGDGKMDVAATNDLGNSISILVQAPALLFSPESLRFDSHRAGTTSPPQTITVQNVSNIAIQISGPSITGNDPGDFAATTDCPPSLPAGGVCTMMITFSPVTGGSRSANATLLDDGGNNPSTVSLSGTGVAVVLSPGMLNFGDVYEGTISQPMFTSLKNIGIAPVEIDRIYLTGAFPSSYLTQNNCPATFPAGGECRIEVEFTPKRIGLQPSRLQVDDSDGGSPQKAALSGVGNIPPR